MKPEYWAKACRELSVVDVRLGKIIKAYDGEFLASRGNSFETLLRSIVGQQISVKAAQSVWNKFVGVYFGKHKKMRTIKPEAFLALTVAQLRGCGFSQRKVEYCQDLARHYVEKKLQPLKWKSYDDEEVIAELIAVRGIGRWTAEMFLIFHLLRPNVFPVDDLGLQKALSLCYKKSYPLNKAQLQQFRLKFSPWGSVATWYLWRSLDPMPVEY